MQSRFYVYFLIWASKEIIQPSFVFPPLYYDFYRLLIATYMDHWVPKMFFYLTLYGALTNKMLQKKFFDVTRRWGTK